MQTLNSCNQDGMFPSVSVAVRDNKDVDGFIDDCKLELGTFIGREVFSTVFNKVLRFNKNSQSSNISLNLDVFPWGGTLLDARLIDQFGLPETHYVLYCEDFLWSNYLSNHGVGIAASPQSILHVFDTPYMRDQQEKLSVRRFLVKSNIGTLYYRIRNEVAFRSALSRTFSESILFSANKVVWVLAIFSILALQPERRKIVLAALADGARQDFTRNFPLVQ
jgi:hypothetical protein